MTCVAESFVQRHFDRQCFEDAGVFVEKLIDNSLKVALNGVRKNSSGIRRGINLFPEKGQHERGMPEETGFDQQFPSSNFSKIVVLDSIQQDLK
ncbi:uncharacterized protein CCOS01_14683 [Colletotrichum costaricense]|uniref:Uncharacterized protein n=1 Tax=Colletotrichum costaricense TaxID=1209916 RepID=A0AAI9YIU0_9PEZI|nr:uncharacterized protein CCOS01_14683 [Colletotrichum costaricense]KAK1512443.1 hypothetical protein CCOS01_14683 [Colletotrichum costaricense]